MITELLLGLMLVLLLTFVWAVFFIGTMYLVAVLFHRLEDRHTDKHKER